MAGLTIYTGCMFSGKTSRMLLDVEKHRHAGREVHAFKPTVDERYSVDEIVTHLGSSIQAKRVTTGTDIARIMLEDVIDVSNPSNHVVVVDELFMIPDAAEELIWMYQQGMTVVVATLDLSYQCKPFEEVIKLFPWATRVEKCSAACSVCGQDAFYTHRKAIDAEDEIAVGGAESYEPRCLRHHPVISLEGETAR